MSYDYDRDVDNGHWYLSEDDQLYIIPTEVEGIQENLGPDDAIMDAINTLCRHGVRELSDATMATLGLTYIYHWQHRFNEDDGWYYT